MNERDAIRKLLATGHLNVPERKSLPCERARFSVMVEVVTEALASSGWFPRALATGEDVGSGGILELGKGSVRLHEQHEIGVCRYSPISVTAFGSVARALRAFIKANGGDPIDGIPVDWRE